MRKTILAALAALTLAATASAEIRGHYLETRNAEIYASHCFANSESGIRGDLAIMAWSVDAGDVDGVNVDGLRVVAVVKASSTIGNPFTNPLPTKTMLIVDEKANPEQRAALETLARRSAGELISEVVLTEAQPINLEFSRRFARQARHVDRRRHRQGHDPRHQRDRFALPPRQYLLPTHG